MSYKKSGFTPLEFLKNFFWAKRNNQKTLTGFTLIELLVVIAIIGLLASIVMVSVNSARAKANNAKCAADLKQIVTAIELKRDANNTVLLGVTGSGCSACNCWYNGLTSPSCISSMTTAFQRLGFPGLLKDPWGNPYLIDENEWEGGPSACSYTDTLYSTTCGYIYVPFYACK